MSSRIEESYNSIYKDLSFERSDLFKAISQHYQIDTVLYPGCNIHITPSFYFQHVIYIDIASNAIRFFAEKKEVIDFIQKNKVYKQTPYIQFFNQDFTKPLPVHEKGFDLIIALFAGGIVNSTIQYLKKGGFILTNNHDNDACEGMNNSKLLPFALLSKGKKGYQILNANAELFSNSIAKHKNKLLNNNPRGGLQYQENETFYLFQKVRD